MWQFKEHTKLKNWSLIGLLLLLFLYDSNQRINESYNYLSLKHQKMLVLSGLKARFHFLMFLIHLFSVVD